MPREKNLSDADLDAKLSRLQSEKNRRLEEEAKKLEAQRQEAANRNLENVDTILSLMEHGRTSCSDENPCNDSGSCGRVRCTKCEIMMFKSQGFWPGEFELSISGNYVS